MNMMVNGAHAIEKEGEITIKTRTRGEDIFKNETTTDTWTDYYFVRGKLITKASRSETRGVDILGNESISHTWTTYTYKDKAGNIYAGGEIAKGSYVKNKERLQTPNLAL